LGQWRPLLHRFFIYKNKVKFEHRACTFLSIHLIASKYIPTHFAINCFMCNKHLSNFWSWMWQLMFTLECPCVTYPWLRFLVFPIASPNWKQLVSHSLSQALILDLGSIDMFLILTTFMLDVWMFNSYQAKARDYDKNVYIGQCYN
jgi:hypothetical protein